MTRILSEGSKGRRPTVVALLMALSCSSPLFAQAGAVSVPSPEDHLGHPLGARFTPHAAARDYALALAAASTAVEFVPYGTTFEGRELFQLVIATPAHHSRLGEILAANAEMTRTTTPEARAREIASSNPAVVYFSFGVHGNEASSTEAALWTAYDLASGAAEVASVLDSAIVVIDPVANPDGRDRYVNWYASVVGASPNPEPQSREHREPWPGGRLNHYLFDLNRDWAWMVQPETRARLVTWSRWNPQVHVDFHEMSPTSTYFFFPAAAPINPIYPGHVLEWGRRFGEANARTFDLRGWRYFTGENYDLLYPGYGDSWPSLLGAVGMTYEQAGGGSAGLAYRRADGDTLTLAERAGQHRAAANATLRTVATGKSRLLLDFAAAHRTAGEGHRDFLLVPGADPTRLDALVDHLLAQGVEVERAGTAFRVTAEAYPGFAARRDFPAGSALVRARQPRGRLAVTLLQAETELRGDYSYDISAWSLPYAYGIEAHRIGAAPPGRWSPATPALRGDAALAPSGYGYLVAAHARSTPAMIRYLQAGGTARVLAREASFAGRTWPAGTWFVASGPGDGELERIQTAGLSAFATPIAGGLSDSGIDLGSAYAPAVRLPRGALIGGEGVSATSYGAHWFHLEQQLGLRFDALLLRDLPGADLGDYDVLVLPDLSGSLSEAASEALRRWVREGGRLIAVAGAAEAVAELADIELRREQEEDTDDAATLDRLLEGRQERERREWNEEIPGAILEVRLDPAHPVAWGAAVDGAPARLFVLHSAGRSFEPREGAETVAYFPAALRPTSGVISENNLRRMERSAWLITRSLGDGRLILFADDPLFRLFWTSTKPMYLNALLYGHL